MDIHCKYCGEPWDHDELHDMPTPQSLAKNGEALPYKEAAALINYMRKENKLEPIENLEEKLGMIVKMIYYQS